MSSDRTSYTLEPSLEGSDDPQYVAASCDEDAHTQRIAELFKREHDKVAHYLAARTGSWAEARDMAAQAFKQLLEINPRTVSNLKAYVYKIARNISIDRAKIAAVRARLNSVASYDFAQSSPSADSALFEHERMRSLQNAIDALPPRCRMAFVLRLWDDLSYAEILARFAALGVIINERTVRRWVAYSFDRCREELLQTEKSVGERT